MKNSNITACPWNLDSYFGRWMYYFWITNPKLNFISSTTIEEAKKIRLSYAYGSIPEDITEAQLLYAKQIYENAFHPDTAEVQNIFGRLSFSPIGKSLLVSVLLTQLNTLTATIHSKIDDTTSTCLDVTNLYLPEFMLKLGKWNLCERQCCCADQRFTQFLQAWDLGLKLKKKNNSPSYVWHGINQSYDSLVNFTNRNGDTKFSQIKLYIPTLTTIASSTLATIYVEKFISNKIICHPTLYGLIPISTLLIASIINTPIMRYNEIIDGVGIYDCNKDKIGFSKIAAIKGIGETIISRIVMFVPGIYIVNYLDDVLYNNSCWFRRNQWAHFPFKSIGYGLLLIGMLPTACAIFPQFSSIESNTLKHYDKEAYTQISENCSTIPNKVYFNKGM